MTTLDQWRRARGLTFAQLGDLLEVSKPTAWRLCVGKTLPSRATMGRIWALTEGAVPLAAFYAGPAAPASEAA